MLCDTCRYTERPGFVRSASAARDMSANGMTANGMGADAMIPCPDCGGQGIGHCCDGICEQPDLGVQDLGAQQGGGAQRQEIR